MREEFFNELREFVSLYPADDGAATDKLFVASRVIDGADIWKRIPTQQIAEALASFDKGAASAILKGMSGEVAYEVVSKVVELTALEPDGPKPKAKGISASSNLKSHFVGSMYRDVVLRSYEIENNLIHPLDVSSRVVREVVDLVVRGVTVYSSIAGIAVDDPKPRGVKITVSPGFADLPHIPLLPAHVSKRSGMKPSAKKK